MGGVRRTAPARRVAAWGGSQGLSEPQDPMMWAPGSERGHTGLWSSTVPLWICPALLAPCGDPHTGTGAGAVEGGPCSAAREQRPGRHIAGSPAARGGQAMSSGHVMENGPRGPQGTVLVLSKGGARCYLVVETSNSHVRQWPAGEWTGLRPVPPGGDPAREGAVSWDGLWDGGGTMQTHLAPLGRTLTYMRIVSVCVFPDNTRNSKEGLQTPPL